MDLPKIRFENLNLSWGMIAMIVVILIMSAISLRLLFKYLPPRCHRCGKRMHFSGSKDSPGITPVTVFYYKCDNCGKEKKIVKK